MNTSLAQELIAAGALFHQRGWVPATGGNFSARLDEDRCLITASGWHKGELTEAGFLVVDMQGNPAGGVGKASYETLLHCQVYRRQADAGAVLHTHSVANTVLSRQGDAIELNGYELLKLLPGITTHATRVMIPVFDNDQDIARLAATVDDWMAVNEGVCAYLIRGHGLYAWGENVRVARYRVEAIEFMLECELNSR